jgi:hypothetical protein
MFDLIPSFLPLGSFVDNSFMIGGGCTGFHRIAFGLGDSIASSMVLLFTSGMLLLFLLLQSNRIESKNFGLWVLYFSVT